MSAATPPYRECFLYVDADDVAQVSAALADHFGPAERFDRFVAGDIEVDVVKNGLRLPNRRDTFVDWTTKVEVYAGSAPDAEVVRFVADLMTYLRSGGHRVVAACDFEDELPQLDLR